MQLLKSPSLDPYFNIATEEYLLKNSTEDILYIYRNSPCVIIGKHQTHNLEVNIPYIRRKGIPVIRRISGGGSVYHDKNNLNYTIITSSTKAWVDFERFTNPLMQYLANMGLEPELKSKSDIRLLGKKISGNASHIFKNRTLHHGSILVATNLEELKNALQNTPSHYKNQTVHSRRSVVTNISEELTYPLKIMDFTEHFISSLRNNKLLSEEKNFSPEMKRDIENLSREKYQTINWNVLYNANYSFENTFLHHDSLTTIKLDVEKGFCKTVDINSVLSNEIKELTKNVPHETSAFINTLKDIFSKEEVLNYFF